MNGEFLSRQVAYQIYTHLIMDVAKKTKWQLCFEVSTELVILSLI